MAMDTPRNTGGADVAWEGKKREKTLREAIICQGPEAFMAVSSIREAGVADPVTVAALARHALLSDELEDGTCAGALGALLTLDPLAGLTAVLLCSQSSNPAAQDSSMAFLAVLPGWLALPRAEAVMEDPKMSNFIKATALHALLLLDANSAKNWAEHFASDPHEYLRKTAESVLESIREGKPGFIDEVQPIANLKKSADEIEELAGKSIHAVFQSASPAGTAALSALLASDHDPLTKACVLGALLAVADSDTQAQALAKLAELDAEAGAIFAEALSDPYDLLVERVGVERALALLQEEEGSGTSRSSASWIALDRVKYGTSG